MTVTINGTSGITSPGGDANASLTSSGNQTAAAMIPTGATVPANGVFLPASNAVGVATNSTERMRIDSSGNLLVGTTSNDAARFRVRGSGTTSSTYSVKISNSADSIGFALRDDGYFSSPYIYSKTSGSAANVYVDADGTCWRSTSSLKYKTDVQDANHGLSDVLNLRAVTYKQKAPDANGNTIEQRFGGLIAEEVEAAGLTEFVQYAPDGTPDALAYGNMVSLCIKAIQELKAEVDGLKAQLEAK